MVWEGEKKEGERKREERKGEEREGKKEERKGEEKRIALTFQSLSRKSKTNWAIY